MRTGFTTPQSASKPVRRFSILIVPDGGTPRRFQVPMIWLKIIIAAAALFTVLAVIAAISYATLFTKALERDDLLAENQRLVRENQHVNSLVKEVAESRRSLARIIKSLGGKLDLDTMLTGELER